MPCDTITTVTVQQELKNLDINLLAKALESMGFSVVIIADGKSLKFNGVHNETGVFHSGTYINNTLRETLRPLESIALSVNQVKVAYSHQVVQKSLMPGWKLKSVGKNKYQAAKQ